MIRIADLPTTALIDAESYVIIERPGYDEGTFKSTVQSLQEAITVHASVTKEDNIVRLLVQDINGTTEVNLVTPVANVTENPDGTLTFTVTDATGTTSAILAKGPLVIDPEPTYNSGNFVTSGTVYNKVSSIEDRLALLESQRTTTYYLVTLTQDDVEVTTEEEQPLLTPMHGTIEEMNENGGSPASPFRVEGIVFDNLANAIAEASQGGTVRLLGDASVNGFEIESGSDIVIDLNGFNLTVISNSSEMSASTIKIHPEATVLMRNGHLTFFYNNFAEGIENYGNVLIENVVIGTLNTASGCLLSHKFGQVKLTTGTQIKAVGSQVPFRLMYGETPEYDSKCVLQIVDTTVSIQGTGEFGKADRADEAMFAQNAGIIRPNAATVDVTPLNPPCDWVDYDTDNKIYKFVG